MEESTLGSGLELRNMDKVSTNGLVVIGTKECGETTSKMDKESNGMQAVTRTMVICLTTKRKDKAH